MATLPLIYMRVKPSRKQRVADVRLASGGGRASAAYDELQNKSRARLQVILGTAGKVLTLSCATGTSSVTLAAILAPRGP